MRACTHTHTHTHTPKKQKQSNTSDVESHSHQITQTLILLPPPPPPPPHLLPESGQKLIPSSSHPCTQHRSQTPPSFHNNIQSPPPPPPSPDVNFSMIYNQPKRSTLEPLGQQQIIYLPHLYPYEPSDRSPSASSHPPHPMLQHTTKWGMLWTNVMKLLSPNAVKLPARTRKRKHRWKNSTCTIRQTQPTKSYLTHLMDKITTQRNVQSQNCQVRTDNYDRVTHSHGLHIHPTTMISLCTLNIGQNKAKQNKKSKHNNTPNTAVELPILQQTHLATTKSYTKRASPTSQHCNL